MMFNIPPMIPGHYYSIITEGDNTLVAAVSVSLLEKAVMASGTICLASITIVSTQSFAKGDITTIFLTGT